MKINFTDVFFSKKRGVLSMNSPGYRIKPYNKNKDLALRALEKESLYLPGLFGQWSVWERNIEKIVSTLGTVVQMGNIVGFNEDVKTHVEGSRSYNSVLVDSILSNYLGLSNDGSKSNTVNWVQIIGANEIIALIDVENKQSALDDYAAQLLREAYFSKESSMVFAYEHNGRLVTHGGLTHGLWEELGKPKTAKKAASLINEKFGRQLYLGESLRVGSPPNLSSDVVFCDDIHELYPSWIYAKEACPFEQVFSQTINSIRGRAAKNSEHSPLYWLDDNCFSYPRFGSVLAIRDTQFFGLDLGLNNARKLSLDSSRKLWVEKSYGA